MSDDKTDLTRIEDLSEYVHQEDEELEQQFEITGEIELNENGLSIDDLPTEFPQEDETGKFSIPGELEIGNIPETPEYEPTELDSDHDEESFDLDSGLDFQDEEEQEADEPEQIELEDDAPSFEIEEARLSIDEEPLETLQEVEEIEEAASEEQEDIRVEDMAPSPAPVEQSFDSDIKNFGESSAFTEANYGGNPPITIKITQIRNPEIPEKILDTLRSFQLVDDSNLEVFQNSLELGQVLITQLPEFTAIMLACELRQFDINIELGLSDEIVKTAGKLEAPQLGQISHVSLNQNRENFQSLNIGPIDRDQIVLTTLNQIPGKEVLYYQKILTYFANISAEEKDDWSGPIDEQMGTIGEESTLYHLIEKLKTEAQNSQANAVIGIQFQFLPVTRAHSSLGPDNSELPIYYQVICTGNAVVLSDRKE